MPGSFICVCGQGFSGEKSTGQPAVCENIDECMANPCLSENSAQVCTDTHGAYECSCDTGFTGTAQENGPATCENINECQGRCK